MCRVYFTRYRIEHRGSKTLRVSYRKLWYRIHGSTSVSLLKAYGKIKIRHQLRGISNIIHCPGNSCSNIFIDPVPENTDKCMISCSKCSISFCSECMVNSQIHGKTCISKNQDVNVVLSENSIIRCKCGLQLLRGDGCNHISCPTCKIHFCWYCRGEFNTSSEVYNHFGSTGCKQYGNPPEKKLIPVSSSSSSSSTPTIPVAQNAGIRKQRRQPRHQCTGMNRTKGERCTFKARDPNLLFCMHHFQNVSD